MERPGNRQKTAGESKTAIMVAGLDVLNQSAEEAVKEFVMDFGIPLITTYKAKGILPEDNPLFSWKAGLSPLSDQICCLWCMKVI
ncbi:MAG: hypothetical protein CM1200mP28_14270 [Deltaproteobacteria bacterium]|nr:MAG: hypothetical protein CM1200mP28_14270 [Deltaproteobacteria bacterium]